MYNYFLSRSTSHADITLWSRGPGSADDTRWAGIAWRTWSSVIASRTSDALNTRGSRWSGFTGLSLVIKRKKATCSSSTGKFDFNAVGRGTRF